MKRILFLLAFLSITSIGFSQEVEEEFEEEDSVTNFGPNKLHYVHPYVGVGFAVSPSEGEGGDVLYGKSHSITAGLRYKLRIVDMFAIGVDLNYTYYAWHLKQVDSKRIPSAALYDKEKFLTDNLGGAFFLRFNIGKRINTIGNYVDLGAYGEWMYDNSYKAYWEYNVASDPTGFESYIATQKNLVYLENLNYGLLARAAYGKYALSVKYRMSDIFGNDFKALVSEAEFPRWMVGIEIGLHK
jgi:hypothetical protein